MSLNTDTKWINFQHSIQASTQIKVNYNQILLQHAGGKFISTGDLNLWCLNRTVNLQTLNFKYLLKYLNIYWLF